MTTQFMDYFTTRLEYADPTQDFRVGVVITYITSTFLDGWINYVKPVEARVICRYTAACVCSDPNCDDTWEKVKEVVAAWHTEPKFHTKLSQFKDDVLVLARDLGGDWWYFWFDHDVSDCSIGRFRTADSPEEVRRLFVEHTHLYDGRAHEDSIALDVKKFSGWVSF